MITCKILAINMKNYDDWLSFLSHWLAIFFPSVYHFSPLIRVSTSRLTPSVVKRVLGQLQSSPSCALSLLSHLASLPPPSLSPYCSSITSTLPLLLSHSVIRRIQETYLSLWTKLSLVTPRRSSEKYFLIKIIHFQFLFHIRLWLETVAALRPPEQQGLTPPSHAHITKDPFIVLQCDQRVFR